MVKYYDVIIICSEGEGWKGFKYHNIKPGKLRAFFKWVTGFPGLHHINFYDKTKPKGNNFVRQVKAKEVFDGSVCV